VDGWLGPRAGASVQRRAPASEHKDAAKALSTSYSTLCQMMNQGDIEWVSIGSRRFISRATLMDFIKANSHKGYYVAH
jgi:excisionase family DNA binding protein